jgi:hypothetical protein
MKIYKLITESDCPNFNAIKDVIFKEEKQSDGSVKKVTEIVGPFIQCGIKNRNGRIYPKELMVEAVQKYVNERMSGGSLRSYGELGHPEGVEINLHRVSHIITELNWNGENVMGKAKIVDTEYGRIAETLIRAGGQLGVSSRGMGSLNSPNQNKPRLYEDEAQKHGIDANIVTEYEMIAEDIVADPSGNNCFVEGIMEAKEYILVGGKYKEYNLKKGLVAYNTLEKALSSLPNKERDTYIVEQIQKFLSTI